MKQKNIKNKNIVIFTIIGFLVLTLIPNVLMFSGLEKKSKFSRNVLYPEINIKAPARTISKIKSYYLDNYGLKNTFINTYINFKKNTLHEDPIPYRVVEGDEQWFFLGNFNNKVLDNSFGMNKYSDIDLYQMKQNILDLKTYLKSIGVDFYCVVVPDKSTIYRDKLPYKLTDRKTPLSQFLSIIKPKDSLNMVDLRQTLAKAKDSTILYHKTDTHWNHTGAYLAYLDVIKHLKKTDTQIEAIPLNRLKKREDSIHGDIIRMLNTNTKEKMTRYEKSESSLVENIETNDASIHFINSKKELKLLMYRDSYSNYWLDYFNESFNETVYYRYNSGAIKKRDLIKAQTDVFILEVGERHFDILLKNLKLIN